MVAKKMWMVVSSMLAGILDILWLLLALAMGTITWRTTMTCT